MGWLWSLNMLATAAWLPVFQSNTVTGFAVSWALIAFTLTTALLMNKRAHNADLNWIETIAFQAGTSVYSGWLCAATILNTSMLLKASGIAEGWDETFWSITILWVAAVIYGTNAYLNEDAIFGAVFIWACFGIQALNEVPEIE